MKPELGLNVIIMGGGLWRPVQGEYIGNEVWLINGRGVGTLELTSGNEIYEWSYFPTQTVFVEKMHPVAIGILGIVTFVFLIVLILGGAFDVKH